ncbi:unnamed protein product, partial [Rotaria sp. Silwood1]
DVKSVQDGARFVGQHYVYGGLLNVVQQQI